MKFAHLISYILLNVVAHVILTFCFTIYLY